MQLTSRALTLFLASGLNLSLSAFLFWRYRQRRIVRMLAMLILGVAGYSWTSGGLAALTTVDSAQRWLQSFAPIVYLPRAVVA